MKKLSKQILTIILTVGITFSSMFSYNFSINAKADPVTTSLILGYLYEYISGYAYTYSIQNGLQNVSDGDLNMLKEDIYETLFTTEGFVDVVSSNIANSCRLQGMGNVTSDDVKNVISATVLTSRLGFQELENQVSGVNDDERTVLDGAKLDSSVLVPPSITDRLSENRRIDELNGLPCGPFYEAINTYEWVSPAVNCDVNFVPNIDVSCDYLYSSYSNITRYCSFKPYTITDSYSLERSCGLKIDDSQVTYRLPVFVLVSGKYRFRTVDIRIDRNSGDFTYFISTNPYFPVNYADVSPTSSSNGYASFRGNEINLDHVECSQDILIFDSDTALSDYFNSLSIGDSRTVLSGRHVSSSQILTGGVLSGLDFGNKEITLADLKALFDSVNTKTFDTLADYNNSLTDKLNEILNRFGDHTGGDDDNNNNTAIVGALGSLIVTVEAIKTAINSISSIDWSGLVNSVTEIKNTIVSFFQSILSCLNSIKEVVLDIPDYFEELITNVTDIFSSVSLMSVLLEGWNGVIESIPTYLEGIHDVIVDFPTVLEGIKTGVLDLPNVLENFWENCISIPWENLLDNIEAIPHEIALALEDVIALEIDWLAFEWPEFAWPEFAWPELEWSDVIPWELELPDIFPIDWDSLFEWFQIDTVQFEGVINEYLESNETYPEGFDDFRALPFVFMHRYRTISYPVFKVTTPDIIKPFYHYPEIVLYDTKDHKDLFSKVRMVMTFALYFGMCMWIVNFFKGQFIGGKGTP